jgi:hypothetical protein
MTDFRPDPSGYYRILGLDPGADSDAIKSAYRKRAKMLHPDRNTDPRALAEFQKVSEAWGVLKDPARRREYDVGLLRPETVGRDGGEESQGPCVCSACGHVTAQPRYVVFRRVRSYLVWAKMSRVEGIFCRACADQAAAAASTSTWAWGWWSLPGLVLTPYALVVNMLGGTKPDGINASLLIAQSKAFIRQGDLTLAQAVARQSIAFARRAGMDREAQTLVQAVKGAGSRLKDRWVIWQSGTFFAQLAPLAALPVAAGVLAMSVLMPPHHREGDSTTGEIAVDPPPAGSVMHVAVDALKLRSSPVEGAPVLTLLDRFTTLTVLAVTNDHDWAKVRGPTGAEGFVQIRGLYGGSNELARREWCSAHQGAYPKAGEVLLRRATGDHLVLIHNSLRRDAVVKLKTQTGNTIVSVFVPGAYQVDVTGVPDGTYLVEYATGDHYSRGCGTFIDDMRAWRLSFTLTLRYVSLFRGQGVPQVPSLSLSDIPGDPGHAQSVSSAKFIADD